MINKVILVGNVGADPDIRTMPNGGKVANFSLATTERWKDRDGNMKEQTEWHRVVIYNENLITGIIERYVKKGSKLYIEASIRSRKYTDSSGVEKFTTEIVLRGYSDTVKILDSRAVDGDSGNQYGHEGSADKHNSSTTSSHTDDDIPF